MTSKPLNALYNSRRISHNAAHYKQDISHLMKMTQDATIIHLSIAQFMLSVSYCTQCKKEGHQKSQGQVESRLELRVISDV